MQSFDPRVAGANSDPFVIKFVDEAEVAIDITGAACTFKMELQRPPSTVAIAGLSATVLTGTGGFASYAPSTTEVGTAGDYFCEMTAVQADGKVLKSPRVAVVITTAL